MSFHLMGQDELHDASGHGYPNTNLRYSGVISASILAISHGVAAHRQALYVNIPHVNSINDLPGAT